MSMRWQSLSLIVVCQVGGMSLWFSASAAVPQLVASGAVSGQHAAMITSAVQLGFVAGTIVSAFFGLPDRFDPRILFASSVALGGAANALLLVTGYENPSAIVIRFITGISLAGVYPVGLKMSVTWARGNMGTMTGILVGALTLGSALPSLFNWMGSIGWTTTVMSSSACAVLSAAMILLVRLGPEFRRSGEFLPQEALSMFRRPSMLWANCGYLGHMWELYAMWAWIGSFLLWALERAQVAPAHSTAMLFAFLVIASGALGSIAGGLLADRCGRTLVTIGAMVTSGACALTIGLAADLGLVVLLAVSIVWGITIIADSAQFSATVAELSDPRLVGTMLTMQTCAGFLLTLVSIQLVSVSVELVSWRFGFAFLALGPALGAFCMWRLRKNPDSLRMADGRR